MNTWVMQYYCHVSYYKIVINGIQLDEKAEIVRKQTVTESTKYNKVKLGIH